MSIFEELENLNVSEECFDDIMGIVEELIDEVLNPYTGGGEKGARYYKQELMKKYKPHKEYRDNKIQFDFEDDKPTTRKELHSELQKVKSAGRHYKKENKKLESDFKKAESNYVKAYDKFSDKYPEYDSVDTYGYGSKEHKELKNAEGRSNEIRDKLVKNDKKRSELFDYKRSLGKVLNPTYLQRKVTEKGDGSFKRINSKHS